MISQNLFLIFGLTLLTTCQGHFLHFRSTKMRFVLLNLVLLLVLLSVGEAKWCRPGRTCSDNEDFVRASCLKKAQALKYEWTNIIWNAGQQCELQPQVEPVQKGWLSKTSDFRFEGHVTMHCQTENAMRDVQQAVYVIVVPKLLEEVRIISVLFRFLN